MHCFRYCLPNRKRKCSGGKGLRHDPTACRHHKTHPRPPPARRRIHVISVPGFFPRFGRQRFPRCFRPSRHAPSPCRPMTDMACCKVCCGCKECDEGEEGKCCCGNECCAASTYCCNAECVSACSEGQEGDCKCSDACCYQDEYCCGGECVEACGEGGAGPCKCDSTCCDTGEYCCSGVCEPEPCGSEIWCCEVDEDNNPTGNCFLSEAEGQDCPQGVTYASEAACLEGCDAPP